MNAVGQAALIPRNTLPIPKLPRPPLRTLPEASRSSGAGTEGPVMSHTMNIEDFGRRSRRLREWSNETHTCGPAIQAGAGPAA